VLLFLVAAVVVSAVAAAWDWRTGRIPNWLTYGAIVAGVVGHWVVGWVVGGAKVGLYEGAVSTFGIVFCSVAPAAMYWKGAMGGGDLKLFAAIGALCQPMLGIEAQVYALLTAAIVAPARLAYEGKLFRVLGATVAVALNPFRPEKKRRPIPQEAMTWFRLGPSVLAGTTVTLVIHYLAMLPPR
jgi:prepilin peptidase CpaA